MYRVLSAAFAVALVSPAAFAADLSMPQAEAPPVYTAGPAFSWSGCYAGVNGGGGWGSSVWSDANVGTFASDTPSGWLAGGQVGCNYQFANGFVFGVEGEADWANIHAASDHTSPDPDAWTDTTDINWFGTVAARLGYAWDRNLLSVKGGWAAAGATFDDTGNNGFAYHYRDTSTRTGYMLGVAFEHAFTQHLTGSITFEHVNLGSTDVTLDGIDIKPGQPTELFTSKLNFNVVKVGLNYKF